MHRLRRARRLLALAVAGLFVTGCLVRSGLRVEERHETSYRAPGPDSIRSPVKAHLADGSTVVYVDGAVLLRDSLFPISNTGARYDLTLRPVGPPAAVPLDSVMAFESFRRGVNAPVSVLLTSATVAGGALGTAGLAVAIFGSCPTFYAAEQPGGPYSLEAEVFSYSIAPLFESRDVDGLRAKPGPDGRLVLEGRNEALETHYLDHLELLEVEHRPAERVVPEPGGTPLAVGPLEPPVEARDRSGRDLVPTLAAADGAAFATDPGRLEAVTEEDFRDRIDLAFPAPDADSAALVFRLRNSLLTTILLYDLMLDDAGADAVDWLSRDLDTPAGALALGWWYRDRMGLQLSVLRDGDYRPAARVPDSGPIAWDEVAAVVPVPDGDTLRVRLSFAADSWRIDRVALAGGVRRPSVRTIPASRIVAGEGGAQPDALRAVRSPDGVYLETRPGQRYRVEFDAGASTGRPASYLLAARGYYTEWIRGDWVRDGGEGGFVPTDAALVEAIRRWRGQREAFEKRFFESRLPVR